MSVGLIAAGPSRHHHSWYRVLLSHDSVSRATPLPYNLRRSAGWSGKLLLGFASTVILGSEFYCLTTLWVVQLLSQTTYVGRQDGRVNCSWASPALLFFVPSPRDLWPYFTVSRLWEEQFVSTTIAICTPEIIVCQREITGKCTLKIVLMPVQT
jgi:hypothetical protein